MAKQAEEAEIQSRMLQNSGNAPRRDEVSSTCANLNKDSVANRRRVQSILAATYTLPFPTNVDLVGHLDNLDTMTNVHAAHHHLEIVKDERTRNNETMTEIMVDMEVVGATADQTTGGMSIEVLHR